MSQHDIATILSAIAGLEVKVDDLRGDSADMEQRMRVVEKTRAVAIGFALAFGTSSGALAVKVLGL